MKKLICLLLCFVLSSTCSICAWGDEVAVFSFNSVSGEKGEVVLVDFSLETENAGIACFDMVIYYDQSKLRFVQNPDTENWFTNGTLLNGGSFVGNEKNMKLTFSRVNGITQKGILFTMAFELLEDIADPQNLVAGFFTTLATEELTPVKRKFQGAWDAPIPSDLYYSPMKENKVTISLDKIQSKPGELVKVRLTIDASYTYIRELELQLAYDESCLQAVGNGFVCYNQGNYYETTYDATTKRFRLVCEDGLIANGALGCFEFRVTEDAKPEGMEIAATLTKLPVHAKEQDFQYDVTVNNGGVLAEFIKFEYEENQEGLTLTKCSGNIYTKLVVPFQVDGKIVTAIGSNAFENHTQLTGITLTNYITKIAPDAFAGHEGKLTLRGGKNSVAQAFATQHTIPFVVDFTLADAVTGTDVLAPGDLNGDAFVTARDALLVLRIAVGTVTPTSMMVTAGNVNQDAFVNAKDALEILKRSIGKSACF